MIVKEVLEVTLHLESFRNIELYYQGLYLVKLNIYDAPNGLDKAVVYAHPYAHTENYNPYEQQQDKVYDVQVLRPAFIQDSTSSFYSKSFVIKYCEEEVELNDFVHFRIEYQIAEEDRSRLYVQASLLFYDYINSKNGNEKEIKEEQLQRLLQGSEDKLLATAKTVCVKRLTIGNPRRGVHEFHPILFDEQYFCELKLTVHTVCLDYRFRASNLQLSDFARMTLKQRMQLVEQSRKAEKKNVSLFTSVCKSLELKAGGNEMEVIQRLLVKEPKQHYNRLLNHCVTLVSKCVLEKDKKLFHGYLEIPCLKLTNEEDRMHKTRSTWDNEAAVQRFFSENNMICSQITQLWHKVLDVYKVSPRLCVLLLQNQWLAHQTLIWKHNVHQKHRCLDDLSLCLQYNDPDKDKLAGDLRSVKRQHSHNIHQLNFVPKPEQLPIIFEDLYHPSSSKLSEVEEPIGDEYRGIHLFVFVHGFQGNSYDMRMIKNYISFRHPESLFLCSSSNEDQTNGDILEMGIRLANEVKDYIRDNCPHETLGRLSFLGHSLGGLKIRAALPYLCEFKDKMCTFMSFSSPHLGLLYNSSSLIDAGIWFLNKMKNSLCLKQLSMGDAENLQDTVLYKLSEFEGLRWFKHLFLFGSRQDSYSPYQSSRMEICRNAYNDKKNGNKYINMVRNLMAGIEHQRLHRLDVSFCIQQRNLDSFIGRTAHIMFLECQPLIKTIVFSYDNILS